MKSQSSDPRWAAHLVRRMAHVGTVQEMPPVGHYLAREAGRLAGVSGDKIGQWARRSYIQSSIATGRPRVYAYQDVAEAMIVHALIDAHVPHLEIKLAIRALREQTASSWPLSGAEKLSVTLPGMRHRRHPDESKHRPVAQLVVEFDGVYIRPSKSLEQGMFDIQLQRVADDLRRGGWAVREMPGLRHIEVNPEWLSGRPTIKGRRVPAEDVARLALEPDGEEILRTGYDLLPSEIRDAVDWWAKVQELQAAA
jgi:uncharacterized protein (DUF433 family)/DNA-binding transcriptional MerR regulator